jgi:LacI family transcriptional regulator
MIAMGFMKEAQIIGFRLPEDISVVGFDNVQYGRFIYPPQTTVDQQSQRMGEAAMLKLLDTIAGKPTNDYTMLEPQLILRGSTTRRHPPDRG